MVEDVERFVQEQKAQLAAERQLLDQNPTSATNVYYNKRGEDNYVEPRKAFVENNPPPQNINRRPQTPQFLKLGEDYKHFRNNLNQQRQDEYNHRNNHVSYFYIVVL